MAFRRGLIANNILDLCISPIDLAYQVGTGGAIVDEAIGTMWGIVIKDNLIINPLDRTNIDNLNQHAYGIAITARPRQAGGLDAAPGEAYASTGDVTSPYDYWYSNLSTAPTIGGYFITASGNQIIRTLATDVSNYSDWGFGEKFTRTGWIDPSTAGQALALVRAFEFGGEVHQCLVANNTISGIRRGVYGVPTGHNQFGIVFKDNQT
jgi:hypothetical protein